MFRADEFWSQILHSWSSLRRDEEKRWREEMKRRDEEKRWREEMKRRDEEMKRREEMKRWRNERDGEDIFYRSSTECWDDETGCSGKKERSESTLNK